MAMAELSSLHFSQWEGKHSALYWSTWKETVRKCGGLITVPSMLQLLVRQLATSTILKEEIKELREKKIKHWDYGELAKIIHKKLPDIDLKARADAQLAEHQTRMNGDRSRKGGGTRRSWAIAI